MNRFCRYSRISPLALYRESERRAWCSAAVVLVLLAALATAGLVSLASPVFSSGEGGRHLVGFYVTAERRSERSERAPVLLPAVALPGVEPVLECPPAGELRVYLPDAAPEWDEEFVSEPEPLLALELPEQLSSPAAGRGGRARASVPAAGQRRAPREGRAPTAGGEEGELVAASYRQTPRPPYPPALLNQRVQGRVVLRICVDDEGVPREVGVVSSSGYAAFDRTAREWVLAHWRFHPARRGGVAVASVVRTQVEFVLR